jgi:pilus assembly protein CpaF
MRVVVQDTLKNKQWVGYEGVAGFTIGRDEECTVKLSTSRFVSKIHLQVDRTEAGWELKVHERATPVVIDGSKLMPAQSLALKPVTQVRLAEFVISMLVEDDADEASEQDAAIEDLDALQRELHAEILRRLDLRRAGKENLEASEESLQQISDFIDLLMHKEFRERLFGSPLTRRRLLSLVYENRLLAALSRQTTQQTAIDVERINVPGINVALEEAADEFTRRLMKRMKLLGTQESSSEDFEKINSGIREHVQQVIDETPENVQFYLVARFLKKVICDMVFGLGPLQDLLDTPAITEIMIVSPTQVYVERGGQVVRSNRTFLGDEALLAVIERIVAPLGRRIDRSTPLVDARLKDGSRVNAIIPPLALKGPCLTIRRFPSRRPTARNLVEWGSMTDSAYALLDAAVGARKNVVVAGGTGSGKTTLLNVLSGFIPPDERIVTIEDAAELQLQQEHVVSLETRPSNVEGTGSYTIRDLLKNALRMRPDRIIVGECRGEEAFDMLQAMNTGHDGSMTTIHSNSANDAISRIETMCLMAVEMPLAAIRRQVSQAVDVIVFIKRMKNGRRLVVQISEVIGLHPESGEVELRDIMNLVGGDKAPRLELTGYMPTFMGDLVERGMIDLERWFGRAIA